MRDVLLTYSVDLFELNELLETSLPRDFDRIVCSPSKANLIESGHSVWVNWGRIRLSIPGSALLEDLELTTLSWYPGSKSRVFTVAMWHKTVSCSRLVFEQRWIHGFPLRVEDFGLVGFELWSLLRWIQYDWWMSLVPCWCTSMLHGYHPLPCCRSWRSKRMMSCSFNVYFKRGRQMFSSVILFSVLRTAYNRTTLSWNARW
jgi:hypothetical protein